MIKTTRDSTSRNYHNNNGSGGTGSFCISVFKTSQGFSRESVHLAFTDQTYDTHAFRIERDKAAKMLREMRKQA